MQDQDKTKEQLVEELKELRLRIAEFETVQQSLSEKESRCREIVDETSAAIFVIQDGQIKFLNNATMELTGYSRKEGLSSQAIETFVHPDDRDMVNQYHIRRLQGDNSPFRYDYRFVCKDGTVKWAEMNSSLIMWEGKPAGLCLVTDITERKRSEEALRSNEEKFRTLFETANDAIFLMDDERFIKCNTKAVQMYGCEGEKDIVGHTPMEFSPDEQPDGLNSMEKGLKYKNAASDSGPQTFHWKHCRKDGSTFDVEVSLNALILSGKGHFLAVVRDITERKRSEEALQESEIVHRALCENIPGIVYRVQLDEPVRMQFFNSTVYAITGFKETELTDGEVCSIDPLIVEEDRARVVDVVKQALAEDKPFEVEYRIIHKSGSIRHLREYGRPIRSPSGELCFIDGVIFDDTSRKQTEYALRESEERFSKSFRNNPAFLTIVHMRTYKVLEVNDAWTRLFGYTREEAIGRTTVELGIFDEATYRKIMEEANTKGSIREIEVNIKSRTGEDKVLLVSREALEIMGEPYLLAMGIDISDRKRLEEEKEKAIVDLQNALSEVKKLSGFLPICASCKKIRDDKGYWNEVERYIGEHSEALFRAQFER
ncbi:MAG: PAS domain S-box protein [Deltaproteobacteria bacterium]|nr:PAS domain S-box protein [Deltaproteobacteria bacterium]